jgi:hypothetical protein
MLLKTALDLIAPIVAQDVAVLVLNHGLYAIVPVTGTSMSTPRVQKPCVLLVCHLSSINPESIQSNRVLGPFVVARLDIRSCAAHQEFAGRDKDCHHSIGRADHNCIRSVGGRCTAGRATSTTAHGTEADHSQRDSHPPRGFAEFSPGHLTHPPGAAPQYRLPLQNNSDAPGPELPIIRRFHGRRKTQGIGTSSAGAARCSYPREGGPPAGRRCA